MIPGAQHRYEGARPGLGRRTFLALGWTPALIAGTFADAAGFLSADDRLPWLRVAYSAAHRTPGPAVLF
jgi:hypothetical protein